MGTMRRTGLLIGATALLVTGCGDDDAASPAATTEPAAAATTAALATEPSATAAPTTATDVAEDGVVNLVVIGDSLINPTDVCPGCTGFVEQYAGYIQETLGVPVDHGTVPAFVVPDALQIVSSDDEARAHIADAEVIVVQVGFNNALPDPDTGIGCGGSLGTTTDEVIDWILSTKPDCLTEGVATYGDLYGQILATIKQLRDGQPTVFILTNTIDGNIDPSFPDGLLAIAGDRVDEVLAWALASYERWNAMLADQAAAAGFELVDLWHEFNGSDGTTPPGQLSVDAAHPSQEGNDLIAAKLAEIDLAVLAG
jgi:lysophospholipase L1-like esterase